MRRLLRSRWHKPLTLVAPAAAGVAGALIIAALGAFSATVSQNGSFTSGSIVLRENGSAANCYSAGAASGSIAGGNSYDCTTIDAFGAPTGQLPGAGVSTQTLTFTNVGSANASSFDVTPGSCSAAPTGSFYGGDSSAAFCGKIDVTIGNGASACYFPSQASACPAPSSTDTLAGLAASGAVAIGSGLSAGASTTVVVSTQLDGSAAGPEMGLEATQPFTWTLNQ